MSKENPDESHLMAVSGENETLVIIDPPVIKLRWYDKRSGYDNLNIKRVLQTCTIVDDQELWEDVPLIKEYP